MTFQLMSTLVIKQIPIQCCCSLSRLCSAFWVHNLPKRQVDTRLSNTQHFGNTVCPVLLSAPFHDEDISRGQIIAPFVSMILISPQQKTPSSPKRNRAYKTHSTSHCACQTYHWCVRHIFGISAAQQSTLGMPVGRAAQRCW